jgi:hypothetical protein
MVSYEVAAEAGISHGKWQIIFTKGKQMWRRSAKYIPQVMSMPHYAALFVREFFVKPTSDWCLPVICWIWH